MEPEPPDRVTDGSKRRSLVVPIAVTVIVMSLVVILIGVFRARRPPSLAERREWYAAHAERIIEVSKEFRASPIEVVGYSRIGDYHYTNGEWWRSGSIVSTTLDEALTTSGLTLAAYERWLGVLKDLRVIEIRSRGSHKEHRVELLIESSGLLTNGRSVVLVVYRQPKTEFQFVEREQVMLVARGVFIVVRQ